MNAFWPSDSAWLDDSAVVHVAAGEKAVLVFASSVPGFGITLDTAAGEPRSLAWALSVRENQRVDEPQVQESATYQDGLARIRRERTWESSRQDLPAAVLFAQAWTYHFPVTARVGVSQESLGWETAPGTGIPLPWPILEERTAGNGYYRSMLTGWAESPIPSLRFFRLLDETEAGVNSVVEGAAFLSVPLS